MRVVRWLTVLFLILAMVVAFSPQAHVAFSQGWDEARPVVIQIMDGLYATVRNFVAGENPTDEIDNDPPGVNFDVIITLDRESLS